MEIPTILRYTFLLHFIVCIIYGFLFFVSPEFYVDFTGWPFLDPVAGRVLGSTFIGYGLAALFGFRATTWEEVKIIVLADITWGIFGTISMVWMMIVHTTIPAIAGWMNAAIIGIFLLLFLYSYYAATR